jgi:hypothetical protein
LVALGDSMGGRVAGVAGAPTGLRLLAAGSLAVRFTASALAVADSNVWPEPSPADPARSLPGIGHARSWSPRPSGQLLASFAGSVLASAEAVRFCSEILMVEPTSSQVAPLRATRTEAIRTLGGIGTHKSASIQDSEIESEARVARKRLFKAGDVVTLTADVVGRVLLPRDQGCWSTHACLWSSGSSKTILFQPSGVTLIAFSRPWFMWSMSTSHHSGYF